MKVSCSERCTEGKVVNNKNLPKNTNREKKSCKKGKTSAPSSLDNKFSMCVIWCNEQMFHGTGLSLLEDFLTYIQFGVKLSWYILYFGII